MILIMKTWKPKTEGWLPPDARTFAFAAMGAVSPWGGTGADCRVILSDVRDELGWLYRLLTLSAVPWSRYILNCCTIL